MYTDNVMYVTVYVALPLDFQSKATVRKHTVQPVYVQQCSEKVTHDQFWPRQKPVAYLSTCNHTHKVHWSGFHLGFSSRGANATITELRGARIVLVFLSAKNNIVLIN